MLNGKPTHIRYRCTVCGLPQTLPASGGRPSPGKCLRSPSKTAPHKWIVDKKW